MNDEIVNRLRELTKTLLLADFQGLAATTASAADEIERLRIIVQGWQHSARNAERDMATLRAERDEARRLLKAVVDMMRDNMAHDATHPHHLCDFIHRPDIGMCKVCEDWTDAMVMCYPDDFQDEEDGK